MSRFARMIAVLSAVLVLAACGNEDPDDLALSDDSDTDATSDPADDENDDADEGTGASDDSDGSDSSDETSDGSDDSGDKGGADDGDGNGDSDGTAGDGQWVTVFLVRDVDGYFWVESEERWLSEPTEAVAKAAMVQLFEHEPIDPGLVAPAGTGVKVLGVELDDGLLIVDVSSDIYDAATGASGEGAFQRALAHTGTQFDTVDGVELRVEGESIAELWGHIDWSEPATPDRYAQAPIDVERPRYGERVPAGPVTVSGTSLTFESTVELALIDPDGNVVEEGFTTARQPDVDERGPFEHTFDTEATTPGEWKVRVIEPDPSDNEGRPAYTADIAFRVE
jgi:hypothetical protein